MLVGGLYVQVDDSDSTPRRQNVRMYETTLKENHAERAGGACFIEDIHALDTDCELKAVDPVRALKGHHSSNVNCSSMTGNSVGAGGYGDNIATFHETGFFAILDPIANPRIVESKSSEWIENLQSGDIFPQLSVFVVDWFYQGPPLLKNQYSLLALEVILNQLVMNEGFV